MTNNSRTTNFTRQASAIAKKNILLTIILIPLITNNCTLKRDNNTIVVEAEISKYFYWELKDIFSLRSEIRLQYTPFRYLESAPAVKLSSAKLLEGKVKWLLSAKEPIYLDPPFGISVILNPGDSLHIKYLGHEPVYSGTNHYSYSLLNDIMKITEELVKPKKKNSFNVSKLTDFLEWNKYLDDKLVRLLPVIELYKSIIDPLTFDYYKTSIVAEIENDRVNAFSALRDSVQKGYPGLSFEDLTKIWDSTQFKPAAVWLRSLSDFLGPINNIHSFNRMSVWRKFNFDFNNDTLADKEKRTYLYYMTAKNTYKGLTRERLIAFIMDEQILMEMGPKNATTRIILADYYKQPGFPEYKKLVKRLEERANL